MNPSPVGVSLPPNALQFLLGGGVAKFGHDGSKLGAGDPSVAINIELLEHRLKFLTTGMGGFSVRDREGVAAQLGGS